MGTSLLFHPHKSLSAIITASALTTALQNPLVFSNLDQLR